MKAKIISFMLVAMLSLSAFVGCGGTGSESGGVIDVGKTDAYKDLEKKIDFSFYYGGYGTDWFTDVAIDYMENVDKDVYIHLIPDFDNALARTKIDSQTGVYDLYQIGVDCFDRGLVLESLDDLLDYDVYGETGVKVRDKIDALQLNAYNENGHYYQLPRNLATGFNWVYNKTLLDSVLGEGAYTVPRTTDEFFEFGDTLLDKGVYLAAFPCDNASGGDYTVYSYETWFAQMMGFDAYNKFYNGYYLKDGEYVMSEATDNAAIIDAVKTASEAAYGAAERLATKGNRYMHERSAGMDFKAVNRGFYGGKITGSQVRFAFTFTGGWLESEVASDLKDNIVKDEEARAIKAPVVSGIIEKTPTIDGDATLRKVIDFVDGAVTSAPEGVSEEDIAVIADARNIVTDLFCDAFVIPKRAKNKDEVKKFLAYLVSDRAQKIAAKATKGISVLPYGYVPTAEDMGFEISGYTTSVNEISDGANIADWAKKNSAFKKYMNLSWYYDASGSGGTLTYAFFTGKATPVSKINASTKEHFARTWEADFKNYLNWVK